MIRVLILDDRPINRQFLTTLLAYKGYETREANDGREGLEVARAWRPDLAIVDIEMPGMNGVEFVHHLHADSELASTPIIFYTASYEAGEAAQLAQECGVAHVLMKPSEPELILDTIDKALGKPSMRDPAMLAEAAATRFVQLHSDALRTSALVEFQLELATQRRPGDILAILSRAARNIVASEHSAVTIVEDGKTFAVSSSKDERASVQGHDAEWSPHCPEHLSRFMSIGQTVGTRPPVECPDCGIRTAGVQSYLGVPIATIKQCLGWLCVINREGAAGYSPEDERILRTIAAQSAIAYENLLLYEKLREEADRLDRNVGLLRTTIEASGDGILVVDRKSKFVTFNQRFVDIWHVPAAILESGDARRSRDHALTQVKDPDALRAAYRAATGWEEVNGTYETVDGRFMECHASPRKFAGRIIGRVWTFRDVTARVGAEAELHRVARDRELLLESTGDGIYAMDTNGHCTMANRTAALLLGRTVDELIGNQIHDLIHHHKAGGAPYPAEDCAIYRAFDAGKPSRVADEVFWRKDGSFFPVEYVSSPLIDEGVVRGAVVTFSDVSEKRQLENRLEQIGRIDSLGRMAATIAHEFNNVLMGIQPFAEIIRARTDGDHSLQQAASHILNSVTRGRGITQDIMSMTKATEPALQSIDVSEWLAQLAAEIRALVGKNISVDLQVFSRDRLFVSCDPAQMQQVVTNLALNARDAMSQGGTLTLSAGLVGDNVRLMIADTGCGIPPETLPFVFEPLFTTKRSGTGLGLAVAQQLVVRNGGSISVTSLAGEGTRFRIDLPKGTPSDSSITFGERLSPLNFGVRRVVVVEDDPAVAAGLSMMLESRDVAVRVVTLGAEAVDAVAAFRPDAVVIDISLPDMSGTDVYAQICAQWPHLGIIFSTGNADESQLPGGDSIRTAFLRKPYSSEALIAKLREVAPPDRRLMSL